MVILIGSIVVIDIFIKMVEMVIEMWIWLICLDFEVGYFLNFGGMMYLVFEERIYFFGRDLVDDFEERIEVEIFYVDVGIGIMIVVGVVVENENVGIGV